MVKILMGIDAATQPTFSAMAPMSFLTWARNQLFSVENVALLIASYNLSVVSG